MTRSQNSQSEVISFLIQIITLFLIFEADQFCSYIMKTDNDYLTKFILILMNKLLSLWAILYYFQGLFG